jgi:peptidylprolyl isomerase
VRKVTACLALVLLLPACKGKSHPSPVGESPTASPVVATAKPPVTVPPGPAPKELVRDDLITGTGAFAEPGQVVTVQYVGVHFTNGKEFDSSWKTGHPLTFQLGGEEVIAGWDEGVVGMRVGGRRELVIPPDLAYGPGGDGTGVIGPDETLVFVIDLISVAGGEPLPTG